MNKLTQKASKFSYSIAGVATHKKQVLLCRDEDNDQWMLPGCSVRFFESSIDTLKKTIKEDFGTDIHIERLIWVAENSYEKDGTDYHELAFYYLIDFPVNADIYDFKDSYTHEVKGKSLTFKWFGIEELQQLNLYPDFLKTRLKSIPAGIEHISCKKI